MMTNFDARPPFVVHDYFLETAFELRFQGLLRSAWQDRTWHVIAALPGSGKSLGIADFLQQSSSYKNARGTTHIPVLAIRAPKNGGKDLALGMAISAEFGILPTMPCSAFSPPCPGMCGEPFWFRPWLMSRPSVSSLMMRRI